MKSSNVKIQFTNGEVGEYDKGSSLLDIARERAALYTSPIVAAKVNNEIKDLQSRVDSDCSIDFLDLQTETGIKVYERSLTFVMIAAAKELFPNATLTVEHSLSKGLYCELYLGRKTERADIAKLEGRMREIVAEDRPIVRKTMPREEAIRLLEADGQVEHVRLLKQVKRENVSVYYCGQVFDYFYGTMTPSTGCLQVFELTFYEPGLILRFPEKERPDALPDFIDQPKLAQIFLEAERWGNILGCGYVAALNDFITTNKIGDIIRVAEALHEKKLAQIADFIAGHSDQVRVILIAGPSSSGKTTFARRLGIQLRVNDIRPVPISLDDYFVDREHTPRDENGDYDFEALEAIDLELFNRHLIQLLRGEEVDLPTFNFLTGKREYQGNKIRLDNDQPLIIEGIHGLNERLTAAIPREQKIKIYISALTQLSIDTHNRIPTTDTRLIRRIVRDSQFRSHDALGTLRMWLSVRRGEEKNIFPYQEDADIMFNSALLYELAVLKKYAEPLLERVTLNDDVYPEAKRLLKFLSYFSNLETDEIPHNSIIREFIGNSCFY
ncbi:nucleoside kinase [Propionispora hippei]|uniref:Uridine kinase n=1 Tax=Propionispora hippei DSM 15287 TaxID=1123003 RepID=A0A1M6P5X0_9FIRM|nr:nucleoside kinase [Propionispora hippei]SHK03351.1 uridine kinase [Propionispora hippei DSM 15287]